MAVQDRHRHWQLVVITTLLIQSGWLSAGLAQAGSGEASPGPGTSSFDRLYEELVSLRPEPQSVAAVSELVLKRDAGRFTFESGNFYRLKPVGGRVVGLVFVGKGTFSFSPPTAMERERLAFFEKTKNLVAPLNAVVLLFADTTAIQLERSLSFRDGPVSSVAAGAIKDALEYLRDNDSPSFDPDLMEAFLNQDSTDLFYAHIQRPDRDPLMFTVNSRLNEAVQLATRARRKRWIGKQTEIISQFPEQGDTVRPSTYERRPRIGIRHYTSIPIWNIRPWVMCGSAPPPECS